MGLLEVGAYLPRERPREKLQAFLAWNRCAFHLEYSLIQFQPRGWGADPMSVQGGGLALLILELGTEDGSPSGPAPFGSAHPCVCV